MHNYEKEKYGPDKDILYFKEERASEVANMKAAAVFSFFPLGFILEKSFLNSLSRSDLSVINIIVP